MALAPRKLANGKVTYRVAIKWRGIRYYEHAGTDKREAERLNRRRVAERKAGTYVPPAATERATVEGYAERWIAARTNRTASDDEQRIRDHVLSRDWLASMLVGDVRSKHSKLLVEELNATHLSHKTIVNVFGAWSRMMRDALLEELLDRDPCVIPRGSMHGAAPKRREPYEAAAAALLCTDERVAVTVRLWSLLAFLTGMREGEIAGLNWGDWRPAEPMSALLVDKQYGGQPLKTSDAERCRPRVVPVHPVLEDALGRWRTETWQLVVGHVPTDGDPICPSIRGERHTKSSAYKAVMRACDTLGIAQGAKLHAARHSFASWARREGAAREWIERVTHNASAGRDALEIYLHPEWPNLCDVVDRAGRVVLRVWPRVLPGLPDEAAKQVEAPGIEAVVAAGTVGNVLEFPGTTRTSDPQKSRVTRGGGADCAAMQHSTLTPAAWSLVYAFDDLSRRAA